MAQRKSTAGFTMVEIIASLAILSTSMLAVFGVLRICTRAGHHCEMMGQSMLLAESLLNETMGNQISAFETSEGQRGPFHWQVELKSTEIENLGAVYVRVVWQEQQKEQSSELYSFIHIPSVLEGQ